jgi:hypothetical protein
MTTDKKEDLSSLAMDALVMTGAAVNMALCSAGMEPNQITGLALLDLGVKLVARCPAAVFTREHVLRALERLPEAYLMTRGEITMEQAMKIWDAREAAQEAAKEHDHAGKEAN